MTGRPIPAAGQSYVDALASAAADTDLDAAREMVKRLIEERARLYERLRHIDAVLAGCKKSRAPKRSSATSEVLAAIRPGESVTSGDLIARIGSHSEATTRMAIYRCVIAGVIVRSGRRGSYSYSLSDGGAT